MTDGNLMDAECVHGNVWFDCEVCDIDANFSDDDTGEILRASDILDDDDDDKDVLK